MSMADLSRREFLTLPLALALAPVGTAWGGVERYQRGYTLDVGVLYDVFKFGNAGSIEERVDRAANTYEVVIAGRGTSIETSIESGGEWRDGRWWPTHTKSFFLVLGRESRTDVAYDYARRTSAYHARAETFFLRRERLVNDTVALPPGARVDDAISALLNYQDNVWLPDADGMYRTHIVRRQRKKGELPDDVDKAGYRAELVPLQFRVEGSTALVDLTRFSSWALEESPGRITFGPDRRPQRLLASLRLGTRITVQFDG